MVSDRQLQYVSTYGGDYTYASKLTYDECYEYVRKLIDEHRAKRDAAKAERKAKKGSHSMDPRLKLIDGMIDMIPEGRYATAPEGEGGHIDFVRIVRIKNRTRKYPAGTLKIQTQHSEVWRTDAVRWPDSMEWSVYRSNVIPMVLLVIADHRTCGRRYGIEKQCCQICGKQLTDDRSRHYLIGPECETHGNNFKVLEEVDDINDGLTFEQLVARGMPTRIWQDKIL